jgi:hypothetical protein
VPVTTLYLLVVDPTSAVRPAVFVLDHAGRVEEGAAVTFDHPVGRLQVRLAVDGVADVGALSIPASEHDALVAQGWQERRD